MFKHLKRLALAALLSLGLGQLANASTLTPPNLTAAVSIANNDLLLVWPTGTGGPLEQMQYSVLKTNLLAALGSSYLQVSNSLSDVASPSSARSNLGLGTAATVNTGSSGATLCLLTGTCTWSGAQIYTGEISSAASTTGNAGLNIAPGVAPTSPVNGDVWLTASAQFVRVGGATQQLMEAANNLSELTNASTARTNLGVAYGSGAGTVAQGNDSRFTTIPQTSQSAAYNFAATDCGGTVLHPSADTTARTWTILANGTLALPVGCVINVINQGSAGVLTIAITTDTLTWITSGGTGSRTLQANGDLVLKKLTATQWEVFGLGVSWNMLAAPDWMAKARPANDNDQLRAAA